MNTVIVSIVTFSLGLIFGSIFFGCLTKAYEFQDNPQTRWELQQLQRQRDQQPLYAPNTWSPSDIPGDPCAPR